MAHNITVLVHLRCFQMQQAAISSFSQELVERKTAKRRVNIGLQTGSQKLQMNNNVVLYLLDV